ncbi:hypothetical protein ACJBQW_11160, partial [Streptococcus suis]
RHKLSETLEKEQALLLDVTRLISELERKQALHELESSQNQSSKQEAQDRLLKQEVSLSENSANLVLSQEKLAALLARLAELSPAIAETK